MVVPDLYRETTACKLVESILFQLKLRLIYKENKVYDLPSLVITAIHCTDEPSFNFLTTSFELWQIPLCCNYTTQTKYPFG